MPGCNKRPIPARDVMAGGFSATNAPHQPCRIPFSDGAIQFLGGAMHSGREKLLLNVLESVPQVSDAQRLRDVWVTFLFKRHLGKWYRTRSGSRLGRRDAFEWGNHN
jgi:hypothetical protein